MKDAGDLTLPGLNLGLIPRVPASLREVQTNVADDCLGLTLAALETQGRRGFLGFHVGNIPRVPASLREVQTNVGCKSFAEFLEA